MNYFSNEFPLKHGALLALGSILIHPVRAVSSLTIGEQQ